MESDCSHRDHRNGSAGGDASNASGPRGRWTSRGKGLRTRSGCTNCRARRVKCCETKPVCTACQRRRQACVYDRAVPQPRSARRRHDARNQQQASPVPTDASSRREPAGSEDTTLPTIDAASHGQDQDQNQDQDQDQDQGRHPHRQRPSTAPISLPNLRGEDSAAIAPDGHQALHRPAVTTRYARGLALTPEELERYAASPESSWSNPPLYSAETASRLWLGLLANDAGTVQADIGDSLWHHSHESSLPSAEHADAVIHGWVQSATPRLQNAVHPGGIDLDDDIVLESSEVPLFQHFVRVLSTWIDITDPERSFAVRVSSMALRDLGLMKAILALSARHLSVCSSFQRLSCQYPSADTLAVKYYHQTLQCLQMAMQHQPYLRSEQLLATVLLISKYEMLDTNGPDWERHLKGVFWIQRSQTIHGESAGLKQAIWWAWLRQDIWAAFKDRRKILSFYTLQKPCSELDFWQLVNRSVFLLGQCVNYVSQKEIDAGTHNVQARMSRGQALLSNLDEWTAWFAKYDRRLPIIPDAAFPFRPVWINPSAASLAVQVNHFAKMLLYDFMPALGGLAELERRRADVQSSAAVICGIAYCTTETAPMIVSTQCLYATRTRLSSHEEINAVNELLLHHQRETGWPNHDVHANVHESAYNTAGIRSSS